MCIDDGVPILTFLIRPANFLSIKAFDSFSLSYIHRYFNQKPEVWDDANYEGGQVDGWWDALPKRDKEQKYSQVLQDIFSFNWSDYQDELSNSSLQGFFILNIASENFDYSKYYKNKQSPSFAIPYFKIVQEITSNEEILNFLSEQDDWSLIEERLSDILAKYNLKNKINELKIIVNFAILKEGDIIALPVDANAELFVVAEVVSDDLLNSEENICSKNIKILKEINIQGLSFEKECKSFFCQEIYEDRAIEFIKLVQASGTDLGYEFEA
jgi:hypothetical protein